MVHFYGNATDISAAKATFDSIEDRLKDAVSINAMMDALCVSDLNNECLALFAAIPRINALIERDSVTYKIAVTATTFAASSTESVVRLYAEIRDTQRHLIIGDVEMQTKLILMLSKHGLLAQCTELFASVSEPSLDVCNALMRAHCDNGDLDEGFRLFDALKVAPNASSFLILLNACSHCGAVHRAQRLWTAHCEGTHAQRNVSVANAMVDCFARAGRLNAAYALIHSFERDTKQRSDVLWNTLMSACAKFNERVLAHHVFAEMCTRFETSSDSMRAAKVLLTNICAASEDVEFEGATHLTAPCTGH